MNYNNYSKAILTVAIPTYNRETQLRSTLLALESSLDNRVQVLIIDNNSDYSVVESYRGYLGASFAEAISFHRNTVNIGLAPNLIRCFECCQTEWIWLLSDDDKPLPDAIQTILEAIHDFPSAVNINFKSNILVNTDHSREKVTVSESLMHLADNLDCYSNLLLISANVYRCRPMVLQLKIGYEQLRSWAPHMAMMLNAVQQGLGSCVLHPSQLVIWNKPDAQNRWDWASVTRTLPEALSVIRDINVRARFRALNEIHVQEIQLSCDVVRELRKYILLCFSASHLSLYLSGFYHDLYLASLYSNDNTCATARRAFFVYPLLLIAKGMVLLNAVFRFMKPPALSRFSWITTPRILQGASSERL